MKKLSLKEKIYFLLFHCSMNCEKCVYGKIEFDTKKQVYREKCYKLPQKPIWGSTVDKKKTLHNAKGDNF